MIELIVVILLIPSYICLAYILKKLLTYMNGYIKGFNDAKRFYESHKEVRIRQMGMTIDEAMNHIKYGIIEGNYPLPRDLGVEACNIAIDTMRKYQKIEQIIKDWEDGRFSDAVGCLRIKAVLDGNDD